MGRAHEHSPLLKDTLVERKPCTGLTGVTTLLVLLVLFVCGIFYNQKRDINASSVSSLSASVAPNFNLEKKTSVDSTSFHVQSGKPGFPSYHANIPMNVTFDGRSLMINGERALFLGGSMHPVRATRGTWENALNEAVQNGLNLVTIYVFWAAHQPLANHPLDWKLLLYGADQHAWELADAIRSCAQRGLFVHIRVGPYDCAEYSYGGIPEWLPQPSMRMRRYDPQWMTAMEGFVSSAFGYFSDNALWAPQGGPILMAQIENELGDEAGKFMGGAENSSTKGRRDNKTAGASVQDYADWCGSMAAKYVPHGVVLTMCNGLSANNTILTFNGDGGYAKWLERHGDTGRIQVDQPAMWTEDEGGFQLWGEDSAHPTDYFWGHTARRMAADALKWFARGGTHLNYYMVRISVL